MNGYTPIFAKIVDSSLWCEPDNVVKIFITMLAKKDRDNVVRGSAFNIAQWSKKTEAEVLEALKVLTSPDTRRLEPQPFEGRRIERVEDGWLILNGKFYQDMMQAINNRASKARWAQENRQSPSITVNDSQSPKEPAKRFQKPTLEELKKEGLDEKTANKFLNHYDSNGWRIGGKGPMKDWKAAVRNWKGNGFNGDSQKVIKKFGDMTEAELLAEAQQ